MALSVETGELLEHFQWLTEAQSGELDTETRGRVEQELADVFLYLVRLSDSLKVNLVDAAFRKLDLNEQKYPVELARGTARARPSVGWPLLPPPPRVVATTRRCCLRSADLARA